LTEVLPRIAVFCEVPEYDEIPIVVNDDLHPNILHSLYLIVGEKRKVIALPIGRSLKLKKLIQVSVMGYVPFDRRNRKLSNHGHGVFNPLGLKKMREKLIKKSNNKISSTQIEKIYLQRKSTQRNVENIKEIEDLIEKNGYLFMDSGALNFVDQLNLLRNANKIIAATGAALCNSVFCNENSEVIVLMGKHDDMIYRYWANMLQPLGLNVIYVLGEQSKASGRCIHDDFKVDAECLRLLINEK
jgi:hypothetical protein